MNTSTRYSLYYAALCGTTGLLYGVFLFIAFTKDEYAAIPVFALASAAGCGYLFWYYLVERKQKILYSRAVLAGTCTVVFTHYLVIYMFIIMLNLYDHFFTGTTAHTGGSLIGPIEGLYYTWIYVFASFVFVIGWISLPTGILFSVLYCKYRKSIL